MNETTLVKDINALVEEENRFRDQQGRRKLRTVYYKISNMFPSKQMIPGYITLTGSALFDLFWVDNFKEIEEIGYLGSKEAKKLCKDYPFNFLCEANSNKLFKWNNNKDYRFHNMIKTDGVGCSIIFKSKDKFHLKKKGVSYLEDLDPNEFNKMKDKKIIGIDPGKKNLLMAGSRIDDKNSEFFRYTIGQIQKDTKKEKYKNIIDDYYAWDYIVDSENNIHQRIEELKNLQCKMTKKTLDREKYKEYLKISNQIYFLLQPFYERIIHRKLRWNRKINLRRSEDTMISNFLEKFGKNYHNNIPNKVNREIIKKNILVVMGDWSENKQMKGCVSSKSKGLRKIFSRNNIEYFLVDEHRTSCRCSKCGGEMQEHKDMKMIDGVAKYVSMRRLLNCQNCKTFFNRDKNACSNIHDIGFNIINSKERPEYLRHKKKIKELYL